MSGTRFVRAVLVASALMFAVPAAAQSTVTTSDIQRLQDDIYNASTDVTRCTMPGRISPPMPLRSLT